MQDLNEKYSSAVGSDHRRAHGQFFTPFDVAAFMCQWCSSGGSRSLYDPAFGLGAFYFAAQSILPSISFAGTDVDAKILEYFNRYAPKTNFLSLCRGNYLAEWGQNHEAIVCNPPYMRFQNFTDRREIFASFEKQLQIKLSGYTNIASAFLIKSLSELTPDGRLAYIMPLEFLNTGYGTVVKKRLLRQGLLKALIKLEPEREIFPDATTSVGIVLLSNDGVIEPVRFYTVTNLRDLPDILSTTPKRVVNVADLEPSEKWLKFFEDGLPSFSSHNFVSVDYYGGFCRGIATGANEFFAISRSRAAELGIPPSYLLPCITKSAQVKTSVFTDSDFCELERANSNVFLLNVNGEPSEAIQKYLRYGEEMGYHLRYLTKNRTPWYKLERRAPAPLLFGVFSREKFKVIRNLSSSVNLTCYHCFYPNLFGQEYYDALFLYFQSKAARRILSISMRHYGDGLEKFEPNDLNRALAPSPNWFSRLSATELKKAIEDCRVNISLPEELETVFDSLTQRAERGIEPNEDLATLLPSQPA